MLLQNLYVLQIILYDDAFIKKCVVPFVRFIFHGNIFYDVLHFDKQVFSWEATQVVTTPR